MAVGAVIDRPAITEGDSLLQHPGGIISLPYEGEMSYCGCRGGIVCLPQSIDERFHTMILPGGIISLPYEGEMSDCGCRGGH